MWWSWEGLVWSGLAWAVIWAITVRFGSGQCVHRLISKNLFTYVLPLFTGALLSTYCISVKCCFMQTNHTAIFVKPRMNINCIHFPMTCWVHSTYSWLCALWFISSRRPPWVLRALWGGALCGPCALGDVLHSVVLRSVVSAAGFLSLFALRGIL